MAKPRRARRPSREVFPFARQFTATPIIDVPPSPDHDVGHDVDVIEPAWDGHRVLATRVARQTRLAALDFREWTTTFAQIALALTKLSAERLAIDGVICMLDARGVPSFDQLRAAVGKGAVGSAVLICWDLLWDGDDDLRARPLGERRARLAKLLANAPANLMMSEALDGDLARVREAASKLGVRGVVARNRGGDYAASWHAYGSIDWRRSLSPPPPLSNADKVLYPRDAICKRDIVAYYASVAPAMLPHLLDRAVVIQRWPDGIDDFDWYQHRVPPRAPDYLRAAWVDGVRRMVIENGDALAFMVNQAGLTYHGFGSRLATLDEPDWAMLDLDPGDRAAWWAELIEVAIAVRRTLELLELPSVVKTSGQRGLHILVPLARGHKFDQAETFARGVARLIERLMPDKVTLENEKDKRHGRLLVDHKQFVGKTLVAPYSLRAADGAPVSTPIAWSEVGATLDPRAFTLRTVRDRLDRRGDVAAPLLAGGATLDRAIAQLAEQAR
jgi:bifunctional non-homologous end joining protein LigD